MRIWSFHPKYLDTKGLVALWRESLLAKNVLEGKTRGYLNHPQLNRFKNAYNPLGSINYYLEMVWMEAQKRKYNFNETRFDKVSGIEKIDVTIGQLTYERQHLQSKLKSRDEKKYFEVLNIQSVETHPLFNLIEGEIEVWEKI